MESSSVDAGLPSTTETRHTSSDKGTVRSAIPLIPIPNIPIWARWVLGSLVVISIPLCKRILKLEGGVGKAAEKAVEAVEKVAEVTENLAADAAALLPNGSLKTAALALEHIADVVGKEAEIAEAFLHKVDEVKEEMKTAVDPINKQEELIEKENQDKETQEEANPSTNLPETS